MFSNIIIINLLLKLRKKLPNFHTLKFKPLTQSRSHDRERPRRRIPHVLINIVDVRPHGGDHGGEPGRLGQVGDDLAALHARVVVLVDEERLDDY